MDTFKFDTSKALLPMMPVSAFKPKDAFGEPKPILDKMQRGPDGKIYDGQKVVVGIVLGTARKVGMTTRTSNDGTQVTRNFCIDGTVRAIPANREKNPVTAPRGWFPPHVHAMFADALEENDPVDGELNEGGAKALDFSFEVSITSSQKSSAGFVWGWVPQMEVTAAAQNDPLAHLMASIPAGFLPAPNKAPVVEPEPEDGKGEAQTVENAENAADNAEHAEAVEAPPKRQGGKGHK